MFQSNPRGARAERDILEALGVSNRGTRLILRRSTYLRSRHEHVQLANGCQHSLKEAQQDLVTYTDRHGSKMRHSHERDRGVSPHFNPVVEHLVAGMRSYCIGPTLGRLDN